MKYKDTTIVIDEFLMSGKSLSDMSKLTGHSPAYLSRVRSGLLIVSKKKYLDLKAKIGA